MQKFPTDLWQPEGFTFLSVYSTALFAAATCAIVGIFCLLLDAERTGRRRAASWAGVLALLLGNFHSYDVIHVAAAWSLYLILKTATQLARREDVPGGVGATPSPARSLGSRPRCCHMLSDRPGVPPAGGVRDFTGVRTAYALGYGLVLLLALPGAVLLLRGQPGSRLKLAQRWMPLAWAVAGFGVAYLPFAFQRKIDHGHPRPLCLLAAIGVTALAERCFPDRKENAKAGRKRKGGAVGKKLLGHGRQQSHRGRLEQPFHSRFRFLRAFAFSPVSAGKSTALVCLIVLLTVPSNGLFMLATWSRVGRRPQDLNWFSAFWPQADVKATAWIRGHTPQGAAFFSARRSADATSPPRWAHRLCRSLG